MVGSKFYLNSIFFSDVLVQRNLLKMLKKIYSIIDSFEEPNIFTIAMMKNFVNVCHKYIRLWIVI